MTRYEMIDILVGAFTMLATFLGLMVVVWQIRSESNRQRRMATLTAWIDGHDRRKNLRERLYMTPAVTAEEAYDAGKTDFLAYLSEFEYVALGVNTKALDFETLGRLSGSMIIRTWMWAEPWVQRRREVSGPSVYCELESLALRLVAEGSAPGFTIPSDGLLIARQPDTPSEDEEHHLEITES